MQAESVQLPGQGFAVEALGNALCSQAESATPHRPVSASWTSASFERLRKHVLCVMGSGDSTAPCRVTSAPCSAPTLLIPLPVAVCREAERPSQAADWCSLLMGALLQKLREAWA